MLKSLASLIIDTAVEIDQGIWIPDLKLQSGMTQRAKKKVVAIVGPTASGKTAIGVKLAKEFDGEIVSADSRQVYRGLDLGTGKDLKEYDGVEYHMIDIVDPGETMTLFDYLPLARAAIKDILSRGKLPIIVGGTGLYVQALIEGFELQQITNPSTSSGQVNQDTITNQFPRSNFQELKNDVIPAKAGIQDSSHGSPGTTLKNIAGPEDDKLGRKQLDNETIEQLNQILQEIDPEKYKIVDHKNRHRLIRAIELAQEGLRPTKVKPDFEVLQIGIDIPRKELHERIDRRVDERFEAGMDQEVLGLLQQGVDPNWLIGLGLEYRVITEYLLGITNNQETITNQLPSSNFQLNKIGLDELDIEKLNENWKLINENSSIFNSKSQKLKWRIHQFARRQMTWFGRFPEINWLSDYNEIKRFVKIFLEH